jgi:hypothetical protein
MSEGRWQSTSPEHGAGPGNVRSGEQVKTALASHRQWKSEAAQ